MTKLTKRYPNAMKSPMGSGQRFNALSGDIMHQYMQKSKSPAEAERIAKATAAEIGRKKYGSKKFAGLAKRAKMMS